MLALASTVAKSRIQLAEHRRAAAIQTLKQAVAREDRLAYDEPSAWFFPVRHLLGAQLLIAGRASEAEAEYREDLRRNPDNGWSLFGLAASLRMQNQTREAARVQVSFLKAWKNADVTLTSSEMR